MVPSFGVSINGQRAIGKDVGLGWDIGSGNKVDESEVLGNGR